jgi:ribosomal protein L37AE/L43A
MMDIEKGAIPSEVVEKSSTLHTASFTPHPRGSGLSGEKEIEEMAKIISDHCRTLPTCEGCKFEGTSTDEVECFDLFCASRIYNVGYRKQSEGEWIDMGYYIHNKRIYKCSECSNSEAKDTLTSANYCPNCGAKMKGGEADA